MNILFHLPASMIDRCFSQRDIDKLAATCRLIMTGSESQPQLLEAWQRHARDAQIVVTGWSTPPLTQAMLTGAPDIKLIAHAAGSVKFLLDDPTFWERGIRVTSANESLAIGVAETTLGMMIAGIKGFFGCIDLTRQGGWKSDSTTVPGVPVREMFDLDIGIVGAGAVGRHVLTLLRGFEVNCFIADPCLDADAAAALGANLLPLDELVARCDIVSLHAPALPATRHMIGGREFSRFKDQALLINTARGMLIDESALIEKLRSGRLWAILDVTDPEPPAADSPLRTLHNVYLTPHIAGALSNGCMRMGRMTASQILAFIHNQPVAGEVTRQMLATIA